MRGVLEGPVVPRFKLGLQPFLFPAAGFVNCGLGFFGNTCDAESFPGKRNSRIRSSTWRFAGCAILNGGELAAFRGAGWPAVAGTEAIGVAAGIVIRGFYSSSRCCNLRRTVRRLAGTGR